MKKKMKRPGLGHNRPKKTDKERSKTYHQRQTEAGYRKIWVNPAMLGRIEELGSIDEVSNHLAQLERDTREQSQRIEQLTQEGEKWADLNQKLAAAAMEQADKQAQRVEELEEHQQELERAAQEQAGLIAEKTAFLDKLRDDLEAERNRSLFDRVISSLLRK